MPDRLTQHHVQVLVRYANEFARAVRHDAGEHALAEHTIAVRDLASRLSRFVTYREGVFGLSDLTLVGEIGEGLVGHAAPEGADPATRTRAAAGSHILEIHDALRGIAR